MILCSFTSACPELGRVCQTASRGGGSRLMYSSGHGTQTEDLDGDEGDDDDEGPSLVPVLIAS